MKIFQVIKDFFSGALKVFKKFLQIAIPIASQLIMAELKDFALETVVELSKTDLNNEDKRKEAFKRIGGYAQANALDARDSMINAMIELSVMYLKNA